jgi:hypothetical protein
MMVKRKTVFDDAAKYLKIEKFSYQPLLLREYSGRHDPSVGPIKYKRIYV